MAQTAWGALSAANCTGLSARIRPGAECAAIDPDIAAVQFASLIAPCETGALSELAGTPLPLAGEGQG
jgi:hypothetical protein